MTTCAATLLAMLMLAGVARAEPAQRSSKRRETARWLSLGGVLGSAAIAGTGALITEYTLTGGRGYDRGYAGMERTGEGLMIAGAVTSVVTPSLGEWYAGEAVTTGMELRGAGIGLGLVGVAIYFGTEDRGQQWGDTTIGAHGPNVAAASVPIALGAATYLGGIVYDVVHAPTAADRYNARRVEVLPAAIATAHGPVSGVAVAGRF